MPELLLFVFAVEWLVSSLGIAGHGKPVLDCYSVSFTLILLILLIQTTAIRKKRSDNKNFKYNCISEEIAAVIGFKCGSLR